jgi:Skp family chaperone for outer membrane proteins
MLFSTLVLVGALLLPSAASAQSKMGIIDFRAALQNTAELKKKVEALAAVLKPRQDELQRLSQELQSIQGQLQGAQPQDAARLQADFQDKQRQAQRLQEDLQADSQYRQEDVLRGAAQRMRDVISKLAAERGMDAVISVAALGDPFEGRLMYMNTSIDLTDAATAAYDQAHPVQ